MLTVLLFVAGCYLGMGAVVALSMFVQIRDDPLSSATPRPVAAIQAGIIGVFWLPLITVVVIDT